MRGLRLVVTTEDFEEALRFYRDVLGMPEQFSRRGDDGRVAILDAGLATLELGDPRNAELVDRVEVGRMVAGHLRVALEVEDARAATETAARHGARVVAPAVRTPWGSLNARLAAPGGLHLTLYSNDTHVAPPAGIDSSAAQPGATPVHLAEPDPGWAAAGRRAVAQARAALGPVARLVEHAGSTAVPGLAAKPVIDLVLAVPDSADEPAYVPALESLGYVLARREPEWYEHRLLKHTDPVTNLHVFPLGSTEIERMLAFRDHLRRDARDRALYEAAKRELATRPWRAVQDYADAKTAVVREITARALAGPPDLRDTFVLVSGPPGDGTSALAGDLARDLGLPLFAEDAVQEALLAELPASDVDGSRPLGRAAASAVLALAASSRGAVLAGVWRPGRATAIAALPGGIVEVRCPRAPGPVAGGWPVLEVDTTGRVDVATVSRQVRQLARQGPTLDSGQSSP